MTAKEYFETVKGHDKTIRDLDETLELAIQSIMVGFAQEHVREALISAHDDATAYIISSSHSNCDCSAFVERDTILNAYPAEYIK